MDGTNDQEKPYKAKKEYLKSRKKHDEAWAESYWEMSPMQLSSHIAKCSELPATQAALAAILNYKAVQRSACMITVATVGLIIATLILAASTIIQMYFQVKNPKPLPPSPQRIELPVPPPRSASA